jgi:hypothetical protein
MGRWTFLKRQIGVTKKGFVCLFTYYGARGRCRLCFVRLRGSVLRKNGDFFEILGECYVHGYMFGEAFKPISKRDDSRKRVVQNAQQGTSKSPSVAAKEEISTKASKEQPHTVGKDDLPPGWVHGFDTETSSPMFAYPDLEIETECDPRNSQEGGPLPAGWTWV